MKKRYLPLIPLLLSPVLFSCGEAAPDSSSIPASSSNPSSSSSTPSSSETGVMEEVTAKDAYDLLKSLAKARSYKLSSSLFTDSSYTDWLTENYYYSTGLGYGYIRKESFDKSYGNSIVYTFSLDGDEVKLASPKYGYEGGTLKYVNDLSSLFAFSDYESYKDKIDIGSFLTSPFGRTYSENRYVIRLFSASLGYTDDESLKLIRRVRFFKFDGKLGVALQGASGSSFYDFDQTYSTFEDIDKVSYPVIDSYLSKHYRLGETMVDSNALSLFTLSESKPIKLHNEAHVLIDGKDEGVNLCSELLLAPSKAERITIDPSSEKSTSDLIKKGEDGYAYEIGYDEKGKVTEQKYEKYLLWDDIVPDLKEIVLDEKECYRLEDGVYNYYGRLTNRIKDYFGQMDNIRGVPERLSLIPNAEGKIESARFEFAPRTYSYDDESFVYHYVLTCSLVEDGTSFSELSDLPSSYEIPALTTAISYFDGTNDYRVNFRDSLSDSDSESITYKNGVYYDETRSNLFDGSVKIQGKGYYSKDGGSQSFLRLPSGELFARAPLTQETIESRSPHSLSSALFEKDGEAYVLRDHVLSYVSKGLPLSYNASLMFPSTLKLTLKDEKVETISYEYDWDVLNSRVETATFVYDNVALPEGLVSSLTSLSPFVLPSSWEAEDPSILEGFTLLYGDEAKNVPYVYTEGTYKLFEGDYSSIGTMQVLSRTTDADDTAFFEEYRQALLAAGFTLASEPTLPGAEEYNLGKIKVRLAKVLRGGLYFSINE